MSSSPPAGQVWMRAQPGDGRSAGARSRCRDRLTAWPDYGIQLMTKLAGPGDALVKANSSSALLSAHAAKRADGDVTVMLINKDPANDATVSLSYSGFTPSAAAPTVYSHLKNATSIGSAATGTATVQTVPAYSMVVNGWRLAFTFPGDTKVGNAWNATVTQTGAAVSATNLSYNAAIPPGGSTSFGFQGSWTTGDASPAAFTLNGSACAIEKV